MTSLGHTTLKPLRAGEFQSLGQQVADQLRLVIVAGAYASGTRLVEDELASQLRVSRGPIRDALRELSEEGLIEINRRGATVISPSLEDVWELYSLRAVLEGFALGLAAERFTDADINRGRVILETMAKAAAEGRFEDFAADDVAFHSFFFERIGHRRLLRSWQVLARSFRAILMVTAIANPRTASILDRHREILDSVAAHDATAAQRALSDHLNEAEKVLRGAYAARSEGR